MLTNMKYVGSASYNFLILHFLSFSQGSQSRVHESSTYLKRIPVDILIRTHKST
jgi:hypothetical protein